MQRQNSIHDVSVFNEGILVTAGQLIRVESYTVIQHLCDQLIGTSKKANGAELLDLFSPCHFMNQCNYTIVQPRNIQRSCMEGLKDAHDIYLNKIPTSFVKFYWDVIGPRSSIALHTKQSCLELFLREGAGETVIILIVQLLMFPQVSGER